VLSKLRSSLTYANVMATIAVFVALGGTSYAVKTGSIDSRELKNNSVRGQDIRNNAVASADIRNGAVKGSDIDESSVGKIPTAGAADRAATADQVGGRTAAQLTLSCPADTTPVAGLCFETAPRVAANLSSASRTCALAGRRLPDWGELDAYGNVVGFTAAEITSNYYIEESDMANVYHFSYVAAQRATNGNSGAGATNSSDAQPFRCVVPPTNG
jgi:hypothetical protein